jgi:methionyl-tRNA formyltransferase
VRIGLFASGPVGLAAAKVLRKSGMKPACIAVDARDASGTSHRIAAACAVARNRVFSSDTLHTPAVLRRLRALRLDLVVLAWWPYMVKQPLLGLPRLGCLNFHPSLLPHNRGKHYNFWALVEQAPFGVTLHFADEGVDTGDIAFQSALPVSWTDTGGTLYRRAQKEIIALFERSLPVLATGTIPRTPQDLRSGSFHRASELEPASEIELDRSYTARQLLNLIRARTFPPHPAARFTEGGQTYEVRVQIKKLRRHGAS